MNAHTPVAEAEREQPSSDGAVDIACELAALRAVVDDLDYGVVVLDDARRVQFVNRAFRRFWRVPDELADGRQTFVKLMYHGRGIESYAVSADKLGDCVEKQLELIRTGEPRPFDIRLANGKVVQFRCKTLANGGRLLTYGNVGELTAQAEALERLACIDGLSGLNNRRHFLALAENEWSRFRRYGRPLALLMFDVDLFKSINGRYGPDAGAAVIKAVTETLRKHKRASDIAGRLGGEEFALLLPEATLDRAVMAAERIRQLIAGLSVCVPDRLLSVTVSIGASAGDAAMNSFDDLLKQADVALYEAKRSGRNRVCRFMPDRPREKLAGETIPARHSL
jgi:diguanylate cyclase (GGDEF)-like protein